MKFKNYINSRIIIYSTVAILAQAHLYNNIFCNIIIGMSIVAILRMANPVAAIRRLKIRFRKKLKHAFIVTEFKWFTRDDYKKKVQEIEYYNKKYKKEYYIPHEYYKLEYSKLEQNMKYMRKKGVVFYEHVDGLRASEWLNANGYDKNNFSLISWGNPHVEPYEELDYVFQKLVKQLPKSIVIITYIGINHDLYFNHYFNYSFDDKRINIDKKIGVWQDVEFENKTNITYSPCNPYSPCCPYIPCSPYSARHFQEEKMTIRCLIYIPIRYLHDWNKFLEPIGIPNINGRYNYKLDYIKLTQYASDIGSFLFLGEQRADLSRAALESII